jgi:hypothetical protein
MLIETMNVNYKNKYILFFLLLFVFIPVCSIWTQDVFDLLYNANEGLGHQDRPLNLANRVGTITIDTDSMLINGSITPHAKERMLLEYVFSFKFM